MSGQTLHTHHSYLVEEMALVQKVSTDDVATWLSKGWEDTKAMWGTSMSYSALFLLTGIFISFGFYHMNLPYLILPALSGFLLVGPAIALGFYEGSWRREKGEPFELGHAVTAIRHNVYSIMGMGVALVFLFMVWIRLSFTVFAVAFPGIMPDWNVIFERAMSMEGVHFAFMITALGAMFAAVIFFAAAVALPLMMERRTILIPAMLTSTYAVLTNFKAMMYWAAAIVAIMFVGLVTGIGLLVTFPLIGHATWHAYRQIIQER